MYFDTKNYLKNNRNHTDKHTLNYICCLSFFPVSMGRTFLSTPLVSCFHGLHRPFDIWFFTERERESSKNGYSPEFISTSVFVIKTDSQKYFDILKNKKKKRSWRGPLSLFFYWSKSHFELHFKIFKTLSYYWWMRPTLFSKNSLIYPLLSFPQFLP